MSFQTGGGGNIASQVQAVIDEVINRRLSPSSITPILEESGVFGENMAKSRCRVVTGFLRDNIGHEVSGLTLRLFSNADYSIFLDQGTSRISADYFFTS